MTRRRPQPTPPWRRAAALLGGLAVACGTVVTAVVSPATEPLAHPSAGTEVTIQPVMKPPTVTQTQPASQPPIPFATPSVRAPQAGAA